MKLVCMETYRVDPKIDGRKVRFNIKINSVQYQFNFCVIFFVSQFVCFVILLAQVPQFCAFSLISSCLLLPLIRLTTWRLSANVGVVWR
jgi:hypothetical protein